MRYEHFNELKMTSATTLAKHLREELGQAQYTKEKAKELGKAGLVDVLVLAYQAAGFPLLGAPGWPWPCNPGQTPANQPVPAAPKMTAKEQSAKFIVARFNQLELKDENNRPLKMENLPQDQNGKTLIDLMLITGPGFVHPRFWDYPALPAGQEYRVAVVFDPQGKESTQQTHLLLNGRSLIAQRDHIVFIPAEFLEVANNGRGMMDDGGKLNSELDMNQAGSDLKLRPFRAEHMREIGEGVTDSKGALLRWLRRFDGQPIPEPQAYGAAAPMQQAHAG
jgi:hypothetical protein